MLDTIIFGDNQFFGINHMSEEKAQAQYERFKEVSAIIEVLDIALEAGINAFMFNTHGLVNDICHHFRSDPEKYSACEALCVDALRSQICKRRG